MSAADMNRLGIEAEVAFRFEHKVIPRERPYNEYEIEAAITALPAIETLDTRQVDFEAVPVLDKATDFLSNGSFVAGTQIREWRALDPEDIRIRVAVKREGDV
ncbi:hypothetical protein OZ411_15310 [Bradyrhizobium sp. Arg237L]|uniref:hypothetical protein n=1 Tax=Bradyrhizobium sp. Arg237L TaxID=3003352 RepID=UPI00249F2AE5|nr:hypothetical protein [Bradyrhizobium sp. Arg237L]MDI4234178.1 hypothetical protein [Bradyrhizobium sp. Arg237L]